MATSRTQRVKKSKRVIPIIQHLATRFTTLRTSQGNPISGPIFPNAAGKSVDPNNVPNRVVLPALSVCGVCSKPKKEHGKRTDHGYQRTLFSPSGTLGTDSGVA